MDTKPFQIKMNPLAHKRLKHRASQLGITIGDMIQNLLATFELRTQRARKQIEENEEIDSIYKDSNLDAKIMEVIFLKDEKDLTDKDFSKEIKKQIKELVGDTWIPKLNLGDREIE